MYKLILKFIVISDAPQELWNPLSKAVRGKFYSSSKHSNHDCLQNQANFHRSQFLTLLTSL